MTDITITGKQIKQLPKKLLLDGTESFVLQDATGTQQVDGSVLKDFVKPDLSDYATTDQLDNKVNRDGDGFTGTVGMPTAVITTQQQEALVQMASSSSSFDVRTMNARIDTFNFTIQYSTPLKLTEAGIWENGQLLENKYALLTDLDSLATQEQLEDKLDVETYNTDKSTFALKTEIPSLDNYATKAELNEKVSTDTYNADKATFATKAELGTKLDTSTYNSEKSSFATKTELSAKVSGTGVTKMQVVTDLPESPDASTLYILTAAEETA